MDAPNSKTGATGETGSPVGVRIYRYRAVIKRYWWVLLLCVSVGLLYEVFILVTKPTRFVSVGKLKVSEVVSDESQKSWVMQNGWGQTIVAELQGPIVRERAAKKLTLEKSESASLAEGVEISALNEPTRFYSASRGQDRVLNTLAHLWMH